MNPHVSIILPYYEGLRWLPRAVESVRQQAELSWELIIVDDGSHSSPDTVVDSFCDERIRLFHMAHAGKGAALNFGFNHARAEVVCFLDQDDLMLHRRLAVQFAAIEATPHADGVYSDYERRFDDGSWIDRFESRSYSPRLALQALATGRGLFTMQTLMLRKSVVERAGGFSEDPSLVGLDDLEFFVRLILADTALVYIPGVVQCWVQHSRNFSRSEAFQAARLRCLSCLTELAHDHPVLRGYMRGFEFHSRYMRGIHFLETRRPEQAVAEFQKALVMRPGCLNAYYLLLKSLFQFAAKPWGTAGASKPGKPKQGA